MRRWKKTLVPLLLGLLLFMPGCIGSFPITHEVWSRNEKVESKFGREMLFIGLLIVPVYEVTMLSDLFIFNTAELFTDENLWNQPGGRGSATSTDLEP